MTEAELIKQKEKFAKTIKWRKDVNEGWCGEVRLADGYGCAVHASKELKAREAKSMIKERLYNMAVEVAIRRGTQINLN